MTYLPYPPPQPQLSEPSEPQEQPSPSSEPQWQPPLQEQAPPGVTGSWPVTSRSAAVSASPD